MVRLNIAKTADEAKRLIIDKKNKYHTVFMDKNFEKEKTTGDTTSAKDIEDNTLDGLTTIKDLRNSGYQGRIVIFS